MAPDDASMVTSMFFRVFMYKQCLLKRSFSSLGINSSSENVFTTASTLPMPAARHNLLQANMLEPQSPDLVSNYVNIEYFLL